MFAPRLRPRSPRMIRGLGFALVALLAITACEPGPGGEVAWGTNYGWNVIYGVERATCGHEETFGIYNQLGYVTSIRGRGWTWLEPTPNSICYPSGEMGARFKAEKDWLGHSVRVMENGVTCAWNPMSYNGSPAYSFVAVANCTNDYPSDQYRTQIRHRWWSTSIGNYSQVTRNSPIYTI